MKKSLVLLIIVVLLFSGCKLFDDIKVDRDVSWGDHELTKYDIYYKNNYKNAPIIFVVHGGNIDAVESVREAVLRAEKGMLLDVAGRS